MPIIYRCRGCGRILYMVYTLPKIDFSDSKKGKMMYSPALVYKHLNREYISTEAMIGISTPTEIAIQLGRHCPFCGRRLKLDISLEDIKIMPWNKKPLRKKLLASQAV